VTRNGRQAPHQHQTTHECRGPQVFTCAPSVVVAPPPLE
jgi:hypothetical protein